MNTAFAKRPRTDTADPPKWWTTAEFDGLIAKGGLEEGSSTYLWEGQIVEPMPEYQPHRNASANLFGLLSAIFPAAAWTVDCNGPLPLEDGSKPQPDLIVARGPRFVFRLDPPKPSDLVLLVEISDATYPRDSGERLRKYARVGIPLYWIVNIPARRVEVYEAPRASDAGTSIYQKRTDYGLDQPVPLVIGDEAAAFGEIAVIDVLRDSLERAEGAGPE